jgi:uncharacterized membrane protein
VAAVTELVWLNVVPFNVSPVPALYVVSTEEIVKSFVFVARVTVTFVPAIISTVPSLFTERPLSPSAFNVQDP